MADPLVVFSSVWLPWGMDWLYILGECCGLKVRVFPYGISPLSGLILSISRVVGLDWASVVVVELVGGSGVGGGVCGLLWLAIVEWASAFGLGFVTPFPYLAGMGWGGLREHLRVGHAPRCICRQDCVLEGYLAHAHDQERWHLFLFYVSRCD